MGFMSAALATGAAVYPSLRFPLAWSALSFGIVSLGYAGLGSRVFGKREIGKISIFPKILNLPFLLYTWAIWHIYRLLSREAPFNHVNEDLVIGRRLLPSEVPEEFDHYVDLTAEFDEPAAIRSKSSYLSFPILDASIPTVLELNRALKRVSKGKTYIHCAQGHGRTALFALALLHQRGHIKTIEEGIDLLKTIRPAVNLNKDQARFLSLFLPENETSL